MDERGEESLANANLWGNAGLACSVDPGQAVQIIVRSSKHTTDDHVGFDAR